MLSVDDCGAIFRITIGLSLSLPPERIVRYGRALVRPEHY